MSSPKIVEIAVKVLDKSNDDVKIAVTIKNVAISRSFKIRMTDKFSAVLTKPRYASLADTLSFLDSCKDWLAKQVSSTSNKVELFTYLRANPKIFVGENELLVEFISSRTKPFFIESSENSKLVFALREDFANADLENLFLKFATAELGKLVKAEAERAGLKFAKISVRNQSSCWASRSSSGTISLNWRLMLLEPNLRRYVVCHELAHTMFMDHSVSFWIFLNRIFPDAQKADKKVSKLAKEIFNVSLVK